MLEQRIKATFGQYQVPAVVHAVQGDTGRVFIFESQDRQITGTETAALMCIRPDGTAFSYAGTVDPDLNEITVALDIDGGALSQAGVVAAQLVMQENGQVLCSFKLGIIVEEALGGEATPEEISFLDGLQAQLDAWIAGAQSRFVTSSRKVNGKALTQDITITASDVPYDNTDSGLTADDVQEAVDELALKEDQLDSEKANKTTTINGKSLEADRVLYVQDIPSKNLLPNTASTQTINGVTFTVNSDGTVTASGTASAGGEFFIYANGYWSPSPYPFDKSNQYILSGCPTGGTDSSYSLRIYEYNGSSSTGNYKDYGSGVTFTPNASGTGCLVMIAIQSGTNMNGKVFRPMICLASVSDPTYVPYVKTNMELTQRFFPIDAVVSKININSGTVMKSGGTCTINLVCTAVVSASNSPSCIRNLPVPVCDTALLAIDITSGIGTAISSSVPCGMSQFGMLYLKEIVTDHVYAITGSYVCK